MIPKDTDCNISDHNWEKILICTRQEEKLEGKQQSILEDFKLLNFSSILNEDALDVINFNEGKQANPFDKISKYYGRKKDVFLFVSILRNEKYFKEIISFLSSKCDESELHKFISRAELYLKQIDEGESCAKEILGSEKFSGAFYRGYPDNRFENLNINFTNSSQSIHISKIFNKNWITNEEHHMTGRIKLYDQGQRVATIEKGCSGVLNFSFGKSCSCQLIVNRVFERKNYTLSIDFNTSQIIYVFLKIDEENAEPQEVLNLSWDDEVININGKTIHELLKNYFSGMTRQLSVCKQDECLPIKNLKDLKTWCSTCTKPFSEKLVNRKRTEGIPKTLVCHDMKGGYLEDRFVDGTQCENPYFFVHWSGIDTFVYFSHHLVTIPPCGWISAAHVNGVKILGTFITEWNEGNQICKEVFANENSVLQICNQLVKIALHFNFDGWLINIENPIKSCQVFLMIQFVKVLTEMMHTACPGSQVIWYDSVIKSGELKWQNALNELNRMFFHACDGIFLNYNWKEEHLLKSVSEAGPRKNDVYVGVDVFGRGCLGGGGFSTDIAMKEARKFGLSVALFAPGWVYECLDAKDFKENQFKFWKSIEPYLSTSSVEELPYSSSFCPGFGKRMHRNGKIVSEKPWYNLSLQQPQPMYCFPDSVSLHCEDAFLGGGCLLLEGKVFDVQKPLKYKILKTHFKLEDIGQINWAFKCLSPDIKVDLVLTVLSEQKTFYVSLDSVSGCVQETNEDSKNSSSHCFDEVKKLNYETGIWIDRKFVHPFALLGNGRIKDVTVMIISMNPTVEQVQVLVGKLEILPSQKSAFEYRDLSLKPDVKRSVVAVKCTLLWEFSSPVICDLYSTLENEELSYIATSSQSSLNLEIDVDINLQKLDLLLCPQNSGNEQHSCLSLKIPVSPNTET